MDITTRLRDLHDDDAAAPSPSVVDADLQRGRRALNHRRLRRSAGAGIAMIAAIGVAGALTLSGSGSHAPSVAQPKQHQQHQQQPAARDTGHHGVTPGRIRLVDYTGPQKHGFDVAQVPDGWVLQESSPGFLTIAPDGDHSDGSSFVDKLVVMLRSTDDTGPMRGTPVTVNGQRGAIADAQGVIAGDVGLP